MLEKFNEIAQQAATNASRREFLGRLGRGAMAVAAAVGGLLALPDAADAAANQTARCCLGSRQGGAGRCRVPSSGCTLVGSCYRRRGSRSPLCVWNCSGGIAYTGCVR